MRERVLFDRTWRLQVGDFVTDSLRVAFQVERNRDYHPNAATITVYNTSPTSRSQFAAQAPVSLFGGYAGGISLLFAGEVFAANTKRDGGDWSTTMQVRDGNRAWQRLVNQSWGAGVPVLTVLDSVCGSMGLTIPPATRAQLAGRMTRGPIVQSGYAYRALQELITSEGLQWSIQDNALQVLADGSATQETAIVLSKETGLIGLPEPQEETVIRAGKRRRQVVATSLLQGGLRPGRQVVLRSQTISGTFAVESATHRGDSRGQDWYTEVVMVGL